MVSIPQQASWISSWRSRWISSHLKNRKTKNYQASKQNKKIISERKKVIQIEIFFISLRDFLSRFDISETNLFVFCRFRFRGKSEKMDDVGIDQNRENINLWRRQKKKKFSASSQKKPKKNSSFKIKTPGSKKTFFWVKKNLWWFNDGNVFRSQDAWNKASLAGSRALVA